MFIRERERSIVQACPEYTTTYQICFTEVVCYIIRRVTIKEQNASHTENHYVHVLFRIHIHTIHIHVHFFEEKHIIAYIYTFMN